MKKGLFLIAALILSANLIGQNTFKYPIITGTNGGTGGYLKLNGATSGSSTIQVAAEAGTATFQLPTTNGTSGYMLVTNGSGVTSWSATAPAVTGFTPASGSLTLTGADALTLNTTAATNLTLPTSGTLATTQNINDTLLAGQQIGVIADLKADTIPIFVFGLGSGQTADTAVFNDNAIAGAFYNAGSDTLMITSLRGVLAEGTGTETIGVQVSWHATFKSGSATNLNASAYTVTSITTGDEDTSFAASTIPPGVWVWCTLSGTSAGNRPSLLILTMSGYKQNRSY